MMLIVRVHPVIRGASLLRSDSNIAGFNIAGFIL
jgi:hypothetical protein